MSQLQNARKALRQAHRNYRKALAIKRKIDVDEFQENLRLNQKRAFVLALFRELNAEPRLSFSAEVKETEDNRIATSALRSMKETLVSSQENYERAFYHSSPTDMTRRELNRAVRLCLRAEELSWRDRGVSFERYIYEDELRHRRNHVRLRARTHGYLPKLGEVSTVTD